MDNNVKNIIFKFLDYYYGDYDNDDNDDTMFEIALKTLPYFPMPILDLMDIIMVWGYSRKLNISKRVWKIK